MAGHSKPKAHYQVLKEYVLEKIVSGQWPVHTQIPSESELTKTFSISRMTVNRALRELADLDIIHRVQGVGSFVSEGSNESTLFEVRSIRDDINAQGQVHSAEVLAQKKRHCKTDLALKLKLKPEALVFYTVLLHKANGVPIQLEERYVNPVVAPDYLSFDWISELPHDYLTRVAPLQGAEHICEASMGSDNERNILRVKPGEPLLVLIRRTWSRGLVASWVRLVHPGSRYRLKGSFSIGKRRN